jgi:hypothetical protein
MPKAAKSMSGLESISNGLVWKSSKAKSRNDPHRFAKAGTSPDPIAPFDQEGLFALRFKA